MADSDGDMNNDTGVPPVVPNPLAAVSRRDSAISDIAISFLTRDVDPHVFEFISENGRTYHSHHPGRYFMPNDQIEQEREKIEHALWDVCLEGQLFLSPTSELHNVLDIGTGIGLWAIEVAKQFPSAFVIGTDLSPIQPMLIPVNCQFEIDDAEEPWVYSQKFDLIHARLLFLCFESPDRVIRSAVNGLAANGWLEIQDYELPIRCDDGTWNGTALHRWSELVHECMRRAGRDYYSHRLPDMFRAAGLVDIRTVRSNWPLNPWAKGRRNKEVGHLVEHMALEMLPAMSLQLLTRFGGMTKDEVLQLCREAMEIVVDKNVHTYMPAVVVMGRKP